MNLMRALGAITAALFLLAGVAGCGDDNGAPPTTPLPTSTAATPTGVVSTPTSPPATATGAPATATSVPATPTTGATNTVPPTPSPTGTASPVPAAGLTAGFVAQAPDGIDDPVWDSASAYAPTLTNSVTGLVYGNGQLNMSGTFDGLASFNDGMSADLELRAVHDGNNLYLLAEWNDMTLNIDRRRWLFDGPMDPLKPDESSEGWTSQLNDDKIGFVFEIEPTSSVFGTFATAGCAASCHNTASGLDMRPAEGKVDIWHWKTSRSEPLGYVNDQFSSPEGRQNDAGTSIEVRNVPAGGNNRSGPAFEWDGTDQLFTRWDGVEVSLDPAYILLDGHQVAFAGDAAVGTGVYTARCAGCHGADGQGGFGPPLNNIETARLSRPELDMVTASTSHSGAASYNSLSEEEMTDLLAGIRGFAGVPGYYLRQPTDSQADIVTQSNIDFTEVNETSWPRYQLLMIRVLDTGHDDDRQFAPGESYPFGVALMDNDGRNHIGSPIQTLTLAPLP